MNRPPQRVDVQAQARAGVVWQGALAVASLPRLAASLRDTAGAIDVGLRWDLDRRGRAQLQLRLGGVMPLVCDRCGKGVDYPLAVDRPFFFVGSERELAAIAIDDSPEEALLGSASFDWMELVEDEAILELPISPRHDRCRRPDVLPAGAAAREMAPNPFSVLREVNVRAADAEELAPRPAPGDAPGAPRRRRRG